MRVFWSLHRLKSFYTAIASTRAAARMRSEAWVLPAQDRARTLPWRRVSTVLGDELYVRQVPNGACVEALIPGGVELQSPDGLDSPMLWRVADWEDLSRLMADRPPLRISRTLTLAQAVAEFSELRPWTLQQALTQLEQLRALLREQLEGAESRPVTRSDTARRALYARTQIAGALRVLKPLRTSISHEEYERCARAVRGGPEDRVPLEGLHAVGLDSSASLTLRVPYPFGMWRRWTGQAGVLKLVLAKLSEAARAAGSRDPQLTDHRLELLRHTLDSARCAGRGRGFDLLLPWLDYQAGVYRDLRGREPDRAYSTLIRTLDEAIPAIARAVRPVSARARTHRVAKRVLLAYRQLALRLFASMRRLVGSPSLLKRVAAVARDLDRAVDERVAQTVRLAEVCQEGEFVRDVASGDVYRIAGGAPLYIPSWDEFGGPRATFPTTEDQIELLADFPAEGTFLQAVQSQDVYRVAGGAPLFVASWTHVGGQQETIGLPQASIEQHARGRLREIPVDGTVLHAGDTGEVFEIRDNVPVKLPDPDPYGVVPTVVSRASIAAFARRTS